MRDDFFKLPLEEQRAILTSASHKLGITANVVEKDIWLCWILGQLFSLPTQMSFKGGTSLSKVFNLIDRFSEDIDITIDYRNFIPLQDLENLSKSKLKKTSQELKGLLMSYVADVIGPFLKEQFEKDYPELNVDISISDDGEKCHIYYPTALSSFSNYLRDHILIEFGVRNTTEPCENHVISPLLATVVDDSLLIPKAKIDVLSPIRTFWEKATLIHVECHRGRIIDHPDRISRHWYDLAMLNDAWVGPKAIASLPILDDVIQHKTAFFNASYANYDKCKSGHFRLIPSEQEQEALVQDYKKMEEAGMFQKSPPDFSKIIEALQKLEDSINHKFS